MEDAGSHDVSRDATSSTEVGLLSDVHVGHVLILAQERQVEDDFEGLGIGGEDNQIGQTAIQTFGGLISTFLQLLIENCLVTQVEDLLLHLVISFGPCAGFLFSDGGFFNNSLLLAFLIFLFRVHYCLLSIFIFATI